MSNGKYNYCQFFLSGIKRQVVDMLLSYNPLWLRIGLEVSWHLSNHLFCLLFHKFLFCLFFFLFDFLISHLFSHFALLFQFCIFFNFQTIYGEILPIQSNYDVTGLSRFLRDRLLNNPDIAEAFAHPQVPGLYQKGMLKLFTVFETSCTLLTLFLVFE